MNLAAQQREIDVLDRVAAATPLAAWPSGCYGAPPRVRT